MKLTDLSLVFIAVLLPIIIVVYINVSFTIKAQEQEIYYKNLIDVAVSDASSQMKEVENEDTSIDYGYSGASNNKVSINSQVAVDTLLDNLYDNFSIKGNDAAEKYLQLFVPAIAIIDYDGVIISSIEDYTKNGKNSIEHTLKPKQYYSYTYTIVKNPDGTFGMVEEYTTQNAYSWHHIEFTMDDYIIHRGSDKNGNIYQTKSFYIADTDNNADLAQETQAVHNIVVQKLQEIRKDVIVNSIVKELTYAVNKNNRYARNAGITYTFTFPTTSTEDMYGAIENVGILAFVQGINVGNRYLNTKAYSVTSIELATRYYFSIPSTTSKYKYNLYHRDTSCPEYVTSFKDNIDKITPRYVLKKQEATSITVKILTLDGLENLYQGFYPCPICSP